MKEQTQNPGRKWPKIESDDEEERHYDTFRYTPYTTDFEFFRDATIYETKDVARSTQDDTGKSRDQSGRPRGDSRPDERIKEEILELLSWHEQVDATDVHVDVDQGVVTLSGSVKNQYEKQTAERITENVLGVLEVNNNLKINPQ